MPLWQALCWVVAGFLAMQLAGSITASSLLALLGIESGSSTDLPPAVFLPATAASSLMLLAVSLMAPLVSGLQMASVLGLSKARLSVYLAAAVGTFMLGPLGDLLMTTMSQLLPDATLNNVPRLQEMALQVPLWLIWPVFALLPGVSEELLFRGVLQRSVGRGVWAIVISGVVFALFHVDPHHMVGVLPLGLFLAFVASRGGTWVAIFAHVVNNTLAITAVHSEHLNVGYGTDQAMPWQWIPVSLLITAVCSIVVIRETREDR